MKSNHSKSRQKFSTALIGRKLTALFRLFRIPNCIALGLLFLSSKSHYGNETINSHEVLLTLTWVLLAAFAYAFNDLCDVDIDLINKPNRPIPSRMLSVNSVKHILLILGLIIIFLAVKEWQKDFLWPIGALISGLVYSRFLRPRTTLGSNVAACCLVAAVPLSGFPSTGDIQVWALAIGITMLMFGREMQKDGLDSKGDVQFRPKALLFGKHSEVFEIVYPVSLLLSTAFLSIAVYTGSGSLANRVSLVLLVTIHGLALIVYFRNKNDFQIQANLTKLVSYLLVIVLAVGN